MEKILLILLFAIKSTVCYPNDGVVLESFKDLRDVRVRRVEEDNVVLSHSTGIASFRKSELSVDQITALGLNEIYKERDLKRYHENLKKIPAMQEAIRKEKAEYDLNNSIANNRQVRTGSISIGDVFAKSYNKYPQMKKEYDAFIIEHNKLAKSLGKLAYGERSNGQLEDKKETKRKNFNVNVKIISAFYGAENNFVDVKKYVKKNIEGGKYDFQVGNHNLGGDPIYGKTKELRIKYIYEGINVSKVVREGSIFQLKPIDKAR